MKSKWIKDYEMYSLVILASNSRTLFQSYQYAHRTVLAKHKKSGDEAELSVQVLSRRTPLTPSRLTLTHSHALFWKMILIQRSIKGRLTSAKEKGSWWRESRPPSCRQSSSPLAFAPPYSTTLREAGRDRTPNSKTQELSKSLGNGEKEAED